MTWSDPWFSALSPQNLAQATRQCPLRSAAWFRFFHSWTLHQDGCRCRLSEHGEASKFPLWGLGLGYSGWSKKRSPNLKQSHRTWLTWGSFAHHFSSCAARGCVHGWCAWRKKLQHERERWTTDIHTHYISLHIHIHIHAILCAVESSSRDHEGIVFGLACATTRLRYALFRLCNHCYRYHFEMQQSGKWQSLENMLLKRCTSIAKIEQALRLIVRNYLSLHWLVVWSNILRVYSITIIIGLIVKPL